MSHTCTSPSCYCVTSHSFTHEFFMSFLSNRYEYREEIRKNDLPCLSQNAVVCWMWVLHACSLRRTAKNWKLIQDVRNYRVRVFPLSMVETGAGDVGTYTSIHTHTDNWCHIWPCRHPVVVWRHILLLSARDLFHLRTKLNSRHGIAVCLSCIPDTDSSFGWGGDSTW